MARQAGFRFSLTDGIFLALCAGAIVLLRERLGTWVWIIAVAAGHFFLFCNVFRVRRIYELIWAGIFLVNFAAWVFLGTFEWWKVMAVQAPFTLAAIVAEMRSPRYHGIFSRTINPDASE